MLKVSDVMNDLASAPPLEILGSSIRVSLEILACGILLPLAVWDGMSTYGRGFNDRNPNLKGGPDWSAEDYYEGAGNYVERLIGKKEEDGDGEERIHGGGLRALIRGYVSYYWHHHTLPRSASDDTVHVVLHPTLMFNRGLDVHAHSSTAPLRATLHGEMNRRGLLGPSRRARRAALEPIVNNITTRGFYYRVAPDCELERAWDNGESWRRILQQIEDESGGYVDVHLMEHGPDTWEEEDEEEEEEDDEA